MDIPAGALHKETENVQVMMLLVLNQCSCLTVLLIWSEEM